MYPIKISIILGEVKPETICSTLILLTNFTVKTGNIYYPQKILGGSNFFKMKTVDKGSLGCEIKFYVHMFKK